MVRRRSGQKAILIEGASIADEELALAAIWPYIYAVNGPTWMT